MLFVLGALALLAAIPVVVVTTAQNQLPLTTNNLNWNGAYEAAQAGLNDYVQHLDANSTYTQYRRTSPTCAAPACDASNPALNPALNPNTNGWVPLSYNPNEYYEYSPTVGGGHVNLEVSGKAGTGAQTVVRTFSYSLNPASTLNDLYWTNYESIDPALASGNGCNNGYTPEHYGQNGGPPTGCEVNFYGDSATRQDIMYGPVYSDDTFYMSCVPPYGPVFEQAVVSGNTYAPPGTTWVNNGCGETPPPPTFNVAPKSAAAQVPQATTNDVAPAQNVGCYIASNTSNQTAVTNGVTIVLSTAGTFTWTASNSEIWNSASNPNTSGGHTYCGSNTGGTVTLSNLRSALFYVNGPVNISGSFTGFLTVVSGPFTCGNPCSTSKYNINVTNNITYKTGDINTVNEYGTTGVQVSDTTDALGLIAQNSIIVPQPTSGQNFVVDAALLALSDSFYVNNWASGAVGGTLTVFGSIAQDFRGPVGTFNGDSPASGYSKVYYYDSTLQTLWPPYFIPPAGATWSPLNYSELTPGCANSVPGTGNC
jgi:hypothetical protein